MTEVVSIRFRGSCKIYYFAPEGIECRSGDTLIVETAKGLEMVECCMGNHEVEDEEVVQPLKRVIRIATSTDKENAEKNRAKEGDALEICRQKVADHGLDMKLVGAEYSFDGTKTTFFFTSDGRVDFRELVKDLAAVFHNRIELRQIGVRDEAKMVGGLGICGRPYCCKAFMDDFAPVSTKMAKTQNLSLNPTKISGSCGRLMCCLRYEQDAYEDLIKRIPKAGTFVETKDGSYTDEGFKQALKSHGGQGNSELLRWREQIESELDIRPMSEYDGSPVYKVIMMAFDMEQVLRAKALLEDEFQVIIQGESGGVVNGEIISKEFDKGKGVKTVCEHLGADIKDTIAYGDSMNDLEMLETAGISICMENGNEQLKQIVDEVCGSVEQNGIYESFQRHGLI